MPTKSELLDELEAANHQLDLAGRREDRLKKKVKSLESDDAHDAEMAKNVGTQSEDLKLLVETLTKDVAFFKGQAHFYAQGRPVPETRPTK